MLSKRDSVIRISACFYLVVEMKVDIFDDLQFSEV